MVMWWALWVLLMMGSEALLMDVSQVSLFRSPWLSWWWPHGFPNRDPPGPPCKGLPGTPDSLGPH